MATYSKRQLLTYAFVSQNIFGTNDLLSGLLPFFQPIIEEMEGEVFDVEKFSDRIKACYRWPVNPDVVQELIPRMQKVGWLEEIARTGEAISFMCKKPEQTFEDSESVAEVEKVLGLIGNSFEEFNRKLCTLITLNYSSNHLQELLLNWLVDKQAFDREAIISAALVDNRSVDRSKGSSVDYPETETVSPYKNEEEYLCARFVGYLWEQKKDLFEQIVKISAVALVTEIALDIQRPPEAGRKERNLLVFYDGPFLMDALGVCGDDRKNNARFVMDKLSSMEVQRGVFRHSCDEIRDNLRAVLKRQVTERFGPTGDAITRGELLEDYAHTVLSDVEHFVEELGAKVVDQSLDLYPNQHRYFSAEVVDQLKERIPWENVTARERDARSIAFVMRRRRGHVTSDPFKSKVILVSRNPMLCGIARRFCLRHDFLGDYQVGPAIHQRQVAALLWLTLGSDEKEELSRKQLLAVCANVVGTRPDVIEATRKTLYRVQPASMEQLNALLSRSRSTQVLMDLTLGVSDVISEERIEEVFNLIRESVADDVRKVASEEIKELKRKDYEEKEKLKKDIQGTESALSTAQKQLSEAQNRDMTMVLGWVKAAEQFEKRVILFQRLGITVIGIFVALGGILWIFDIFRIFDIFGTTLSIIIGLLVTLLPIGIVLTQVWDRFPNFLKSYIEKKRVEIVSDRAKEVQRMDLVERLNINWESWEVELKPDGGEKERTELLAI